MKRNELLISGEYASLPKAILADPTLSPGEKLVLISLIDHLGPDNTSTWPGPGTIASETGLTRRGVQKAIDRLVARGILTKLGLSTDGTNNWIVNKVQVGEQSALRTQCASEQSALPLAHGVRHHQRTECATTSAQSAPELLNITTESTTEETTEETTEDTAAVAASSLPSDLANTSGVGQAVRSATPNAHRKSKAKRKQNAPTDEDLKLICLNLDSMTRYLLWGMEGLKTQDTSGLTPTAMNWRKPGGSYEDPKIDEWTTETFMGFYWYRVTGYRKNHNLPIILPDFGRLGNEIKKLLQTMTKAHLYRLLLIVTDYFDIIKEHVGKIAVDWVLSETSMTHSLIRQAADQIGNMSAEDLELRMKAAA